ncbi:MAG: T9SS type A sorting domain-containing protein [Flavobacteriales bacterium]
MLVGQTYYCSFRANAAFGGNYQYPRFWLASDKVGMLFTMEDRPWAVGDVYPAPPNHAHITYPHIIADTVGWTLVNGSFVADSAYQYVVLGNFFNNAQTQVLPIPPLNGENAYCLVDNVCVSTNPEGCGTTGIHEWSLLGQPFAAMDGAPGALVISWPGHMRYSGEITDMSGRVVHSFASGVDRHQLPLHGFSSGMYVVRLRKGEEAAFVKFVIPR